MVHQPLGKLGLPVTPIGFGAFKIGRNVGAKYPQAYELPDEQAAARLLNGVLDLGVNLIDTAPAYGLSEERIGRAVGHRRAEYVLATKVGERFEGGRSSFEFSAREVRVSLEASLRRLRTEAVDLLLIHSDGRDEWIQTQTDTVEGLLEIKRRGLTRGIGLSGKTVEGAMRALDWSDVLAVEFHPENDSHRPVIREAHRRGVGVLVKKGLASGRLEAGRAIRWVLGEPGVTSLLIGTLDLHHFADNIAAAEKARPTAGA
ncbi:MAG: aldo/keto reductase [Phycisphaeraceae bacterium]|nr:aldo/keto reductase [Phycisphaeraceae bacterium]